MIKKNISKSLAKTTNLNGKQELERTLAKSLVLGFVVVSFGVFLPGVIFAGPG